jgi:hypothetical protein
MDGESVTGLGTTSRGLHQRIAALLVAGCAVVAIAAAASANASDRDPRIIAPQGTSYGPLSAAWWQYVHSFPASTNPLSDPTGAGCAAGQSGAVFFLVGASGSASVTRDKCRVPRDKRLFFPMVNAFDVHVPGDTLTTVEKVWADLQDTNGFRVDSLYASIDGVAVRNLDLATSPYRGCAGPDPACAPRSFSLRFPAGNPFQLPAGTYKPAVADGFYLLLAPLKPGPHTITFGGVGNFAGVFSQDITYHLVVTK